MSTASAAAVRALTTSSSAAKRFLLTSHFHAVSRTNYNNCRTAAPFFLRDAHATTGGFDVPFSSSSSSLQSTVLFTASSVLVVPASSHTMPIRLLHSSAVVSGEASTEASTADAATANAPPPPPTTTTATSSILPIMMTPSSVSATTLLLSPQSTIIESLQSLPECQSVFNILHGTTTTTTSDDGATTAQILQQAFDNLQRSRDILHAVPELEGATYLLEAELLASYGEFELAIDCLVRYEHVYLCKQTDKKKLVLQTRRRSMETRSSSSSGGKTGSGGGGDDGGHRKDNYYTTIKNEKRTLQFLKAKLFYLSGQFSHALAEYEDILECMEQEVEDQVQKLDSRHDNDVVLESYNNGDRKTQQYNHPRGGEKKHTPEKEEDLTNAVVPLPVIHGAAALSAIGITKLLIHLRKGRKYHVDDPSREYSNKSDIEDIIDPMETSADMLLESRKDALLSQEHANLAIDLGLAASIALTNLGVAHYLLLSDDDDGDDDDDTSKKPKEIWEKGLMTLDEILQDAMNSLTVIPKHKFICMESVRARLFCNIAWVSLGNNNPVWEEGNEVSSGPGAKKLEDSTLKDASEAAKKALNIYDELMNGPKVASDSGIIDGCSDGDSSGDDDDVMRSKSTEEEKDDIIISQELERMLREHETNHPQDDDDDDDDDDKPALNKLPDLPLSTQWFHHHRSESAWALSLVAQCYALAGAAVTAEGIFRAAIDASSSFPLGQSLKSKDDTPGRKIARKGVSLSAPNLGLIARDVRVWYAYLCSMETKRKSDCDKLRSDACKIENYGVLREYVRDQEGVKQKVSGLESSLWLFSPSDFER